MQSQVCLPTNNCKHNKWKKVVNKISTNLSTLKNTGEKVFLQDTKQIWSPYSIKNSEERSVAIITMLNISSMYFSLIQ